MPYDVNRQLNPRTGTWATTIDVPREATAPLLAKVLGITSLGFLITALGIATAPVWSTFPGMIAVFALVLAITFTRKASPTLALGMFLVLTYFMGWEIGPLIQRYMVTIGPAIVFQAAATTGLAWRAWASSRSCSTSIIAPSPASARRCCWGSSCSAS